MKKCEFKEAAFEANLNRELSLDNMAIFTPDRVLENDIGFDAALVSRNFKLFQMFHRCRREWCLPLFDRLDGIKLDKDFWRTMASSIDHAAVELKFNIFLQHKLPIFIDKNHWKIKTQWNTWNTRFYRYEITEHQQKILEQLENKFAEKDLVLYSSPAFISFQDLISYTKNKQLVKNTNFAEPSKLKGHKYFSYSSAGNFGKGFSEPTDIESYDLFEQAKELKESNTQTKGNSEFIYETANKLNDVIQELDEKIKKDFEFLKRNIEIANHYLARSYKIFYAFSFITDISVGFGWREKQEEAS